MSEHRNGDVLYTSVNMTTTCALLSSDLSFWLQVDLKVACSKNDLKRLYTNLGTADRKYNVGKKHVTF